MKKLIPLISIVLLISCAKKSSTTNNVSTPVTSTPPTNPPATVFFDIYSATYYGNTAGNLVSMYGYARKSTTQNMYVGNVYCNGNPVPYDSSHNYNLVNNNQTYAGHVTWKLDGYATNSISSFTYTSKPMPNSFGSIMDTINTSTGCVLSMAGITADSIMCYVSNGQGMPLSIKKASPSSITLTPAFLAPIITPASNGGNPVISLSIQVAAINYSYYTIGGVTYQFVSNATIYQTVPIKN